jgi:predicted O-methyltransferase YrrM
MRTGGLAATIQRAALERAPLFGAATWWYLTLRRQARAMRRAAADGRTPAQMLASVPPGTVMIEPGGHALFDPRVIIEPVRAIQRREEILEMLDRVQALAPRRLCEIGAASGGTLVFLTRVAAPDATIVSLDIDTPPQIRFLRSKLAGARQSVVSIEADSHSPATVERVRDAVDGDALDFLFIDGDHTYEGVKRDFELYAPLVRPGGLIALHDINPDSGGDDGRISGEVPRFWDELSRTHRVEPIVKAPPGEGLGIGLVHV